jgi:hypothetical protein
MKNKWSIRRLWVPIVALIIVFACTDEFEQPYNERIPADQTGLIGLWEVVSVQKDFARTLLDENGNSIVDDKNRTVWKDTTVTVTPQNGYTEFIQFQSTAGSDTFIASASLEGIEAVAPVSMPNMPLLQGKWSMTRTINPEKEMEDVSSILLYNPNDPHNSMGSMVWTIRSQTPSEFTIQYSFGVASYDTLFTKSFRKR